MENPTIQARLRNRLTETVTSAHSCAFHGDLFTIKDEHEGTARWYARQEEGRSSFWGAVHGVEREVRVRAVVTSVLDRIDVHMYYER